MGRTVTSSNGVSTGRRPRRQYCKAWVFWVSVLIVVSITVRVNLAVWDDYHDADIRTLLADQSSGRQSVGDDDIDQPLLELLHHAKINLERREMNVFPKWNEVVERFGDTPRILGLETCPSFRHNNPEKESRLIAPAGIFNSGTNLLYHLLAKNCRLSTSNKNSFSGTGIDWQVNWGKHQSPRFRNLNTWREFRNVSATLPVVVVRDPWTWLQSMCVQNYAAIWYHVLGPEGHCPNLIPNEVERKWYFKKRKVVEDYFNNDLPKVRNVLLKANFTLTMKTVPLNVRFKNEVARYESLAHFWKSWYQEYHDVDFPRLMVRLEDLVFYPYQTLQSICACVDGTFVSEQNFTLLAGSVKSSRDPAHSRTRKTDLVSAIFLHLRSNRTKGMTLDDVAFSQQVLDDSIVRQYFGYQLPTYESHHRVLDLPTSRS